ncbi:MAG: cytochrome P450 [Stellaceae bacterium]
MMDTTIDNAITDHKIYGDPEAQHRLFAALRREDPVHWTEPEGYRPFWTVARHQDIIEVERQNDRFINAKRTKLLTIDFEAKVKEVMGGRPMLVRAINQMDNPDHRAYQKLTHAWFQPRQLRQLQEKIARLARESVDRLRSFGGECDYVNDVSVWYPLRIIMMILGLPDEDEERLLKITQAYFGGGDPEMQRGSDLIKATLDYIEYFKEVVADRRRHPRDDVASIIANSEIDGQPIGDFEAYSYYIALASAGHDTTSSTVAGGLLALIENPDELGKLRANPDIIPAAVEEMVRWVSPVKHFFRTAVEDYELRGQKIRAGDHLLMCYPSANRDEEVFDRPFAFLADRSPNRHLGYGYGIHACIGQHLARAEMIALFRELLARVEHIALAGRPSWTETSFLGGLKRLPIRYRMAA